MVYSGAFPRRGPGSGWLPVGTFPVAPGPGRTREVLSGGCFGAGWGIWVPATPSPASRSLRGCTSLGKLSSGLTFWVFWKQEQWLPGHLLAELRSPSSCPTLSPPLPTLASPGLPVSPPLSPPEASRVLFPGRTDSMFSSHPVCPSRGALRTQGSRLGGGAPGQGSGTETPGGLGPGGRSPLSWE